MKPLTSYQVARRIGDKVYYRQYCTDCKIKQQVARHNGIKEYVKLLKQQLRCSDCGIEDYRVIEFHHVNPNEKEYLVSDLVRHGASIKTIQSEIDKCTPLCANCHRIFHWIE